MISFGHFCIICHYIGQGLCEPTMHLYKYCTILATEAKNKKRCNAFVHVIVPVCCLLHSKAKKYKANHSTNYSEKKISH